MNVLTEAETLHFYSISAGVNLSINHRTNGRPLNKEIRGNRRSFDGEKRRGLEGSLSELGKK